MPAPMSTIRPPKVADPARASHWRNRALCRDEDPELFHPVGVSGPALAQAAVAKSVCQSCPVVDSCREWALTMGEDWGIWGGLDEIERRRLRRPRAENRVSA